MKTPRDYQEVSLKASQRDTSFLDASDLGTGKTLVAVERLRRITKRSPTPRVLVVAPINTHQQWAAAFAEQYPALAGSPFLRVIGTPKSDPESWALLTARKPGVYIIGWEAMRGSCPKSIQIIEKATADRIDRAREDRREMKKILSLKGTPESQKVTARLRIAECEDALVTQPYERDVTRESVPDGWVAKEPGGASRGYGTLYKNGSTLTQKAVKEAMKCGDVPPWSRTGTWDLVVADEVHRIARRDSINALVLKLIKAEHRHGASATPAGNKEEGLWSVLNWLWRDRYRSFWEWAHTFLLIESEVIGSGGKSVQKIVGERDAGTAWLDIPSKVRHKVEDVRQELPDVIERTVVVPMTPRQRKIYNQFTESSGAWLDNHAKSEESIRQKLAAAPLPVEQRIRLRQAALGTLVITDDDPVKIGFDKRAEHPKIDAVKEIISDLPRDETVLIWTHSRKWALLCRDALKKAKLGDVVSWTEMTSPKTRQVYKDTFGTEFRIMVAQIQALAEGVDGLQHRCSTEIWASVLDGDVTANSQAEGRLRRDGQTRPVQRWHLHSENSIDTGLAESLAERRVRMKSMYRDKEKF